MSPCWDFISVSASAVCSSWCTLDTTTGQTCKHRTSRSGLVPGQQLYKPFHLDRLFDLNHIQGTSCSGQCLGVSDVCLYMCTQETCSKSFTDFLEHCCWVTVCNPDVNQHVCFLVYSKSRKAASWQEKTLMVYVLMTWTQTHLESLHHHRLLAGVKEFCQLVQLQSSHRVLSVCF